MDKLEELTNNLCFLSARATKSLSVCTPARYADILCDRLRCYMKPYFRRQSQGNPITVDACAQDISTWGRNRGTNRQRKNPWNNSVDDIMFYL
ncbi:hypothetical protein IFR04_014361 [Cadophora malorum]|uniref:Uncharacterized protein n=1 Tax=Cadophora malorum TaxID=108018 RepID=A0A8H7T4V4_9HELO|nr:hypothetical protein IFR04_014361 [Cadophora malorum]